MRAAATARTSNVGQSESSHAMEVNAGRRFPFGKNWRLFLRDIDNERIQSAQASMCEMLGRDSLRGKTFLDAGSGSGLFSLAARRLDARVYSFHFDAASVACTNEL